MMDFLIIVSILVGIGVIFVAVDRIKGGLDTERHGIVSDKEVLAGRGSGHRRGRGSPGVSLRPRNFRSRPVERRG